MVTMTLGEKMKNTKLELAVLAFLSITLLFSSGCAPSMGSLNSYVKSRGFIPYTNPVQAAGPGTIIGGSPSELTFVAPPETCFPDKLPDGTPTNLRDSFPTSLPSESTHVKATGSLSAQLTNLAAQLTGAISFQADANFSDIKQVDLEVGSAAIDSLNLVALQTYYQNSMSADCKDYLDFTGFVLEGLKVNQLSFQFISSSGVAIDLSGSFAKSVSSSLSGSYEVQNNTTLVITSPTYLGYQLGSLRQGSEGFTLSRAADLASGKFNFKSLSIFPGVSGGSGMNLIGPNGQPILAIDGNASYRK